MTEFEIFNRNEPAILINNVSLIALILPGTRISLSCLLCKEIQVVALNQVLARKGKFE